VNACVTPRTIGGIVLTTSTATCAPTPRRPLPSGTSGGTSALSTVWSSPYVSPKQLRNVIDHAYDLVA
jgi:hypothetical protein